ncbi:hypothetical protein RB196_10490 [Streptomyces sp. PmtA]|uniref:hypothetical protein n=1 Tax=Streptomyces sp. PmtA TaxID=3074275 RepID=UPI00301423E9
MPDAKPPSTPSDRFAPSGPVSTVLRQSGCFPSASNELENSGEGAEVWAGRATAADCAVTTSREAAATRAAERAWGCLGLDLGRMSKPFLPPKR